MHTPNDNISTVLAAPPTAEQALEQALSFIGHDARAGHSSTLALLELQRIQPDPMSQEQLLTRIETNARRSLDAIDDFADLVRARRKTLQPGDVELPDLLVEVVADAWAAAQEHGVRIQVTPGADSALARGADRALLAGALAKLLRDAVGGAARGACIRCSVRAEGSSHILEIVAPVAAAPSDTPDGRVRSAPPVAASLLLARCVAERHGGLVEQWVGDGTRCTRIVLPLDDSKVDNG